MRTFIAIALFSSVAIAATIKDECKPNCVKDCIEVGSGDVGGTNCVMVFGNGPKGLGWYWLDDEGSGNLGSPMRMGTCQESCEKTCNNICSPEQEGGDDEQVAEDRAEAEADRQYISNSTLTYSPYTYSSGLYNNFYGYRHFYKR